VYDALISRRVYKEPMSHEQALAVIRQTRGRHFDPDVVDAFLAIEENFRAIALSYADSEADLQKKVEFLAAAGIPTP
jgi:putative two-component system response regulator